MIIITIATTDFAPGLRVAIKSLRHHSPLLRDCVWRVYAPNPQEMRQALGPISKYIEVVHHDELEPVNCGNRVTCGPPIYDSDKWPDSWRRKLGLLGREDLGRVLWIDADVLSIGDWDPAAELCAQHPGHVMPEAWGAYRPLERHPHQGLKHRWNVGIWAFTPDRLLLQDVLHWADHQQPYQGDEIVLSKYLEANKPHIIKELPQIYHLNTRNEQYQREHWDRHIGDCRLIHFGGPKPFKSGNTVATQMPESWAIWQQHSNLYL